jgi:hypothetical protein
MRWAYVSLSYLQCTIYDKQALLIIHLRFYPRNTTRSGSRPSPGSKSGQPLRSRWNDPYWLDDDKVDSRPVLGT